MSYTDHVGVMRQTYDAMASGDGAAVVAAFAEDGVLHVSTHGPFGGDHKGHEAIARVLGGLFEWTGGTLRMDIEELFADEQHGVALLTETATRARDGATLSVRETHLCRFEHGHIAELWDIPSPLDRADHDAFFS